MKTQMKFQKILSLITLITAAVAIVIALIFNSGVLYAVSPYTVEKMGDDLFGADALSVFAQAINSPLVILAIVLLLTVVLTYIMGCNKRRNYYVTNYVATIVFVAYAAIFAIFLIFVCAYCFSLMSQIDFAAWKEFESQVDAETGDFINEQLYTKNCFTLVLGLLMAIVLFAECAAWVYNLIWKRKLMKGEKALLEQGGVAQVTDMEVA